MTDIIMQKALALVHSVSKAADLDDAQFCDVAQALCLSIEQHEAFRREVSDAVEQYWASLSDTFVAKPPPYMARFIIAKPDPLVEVMNELGFGRSKTASEEFRAAIEKRGGKIVWGEG